MTVLTSTSPTATAVTTFRAAVALPGSPSSGVGIGVVIVQSNYAEIDSDNNCAIANTGANAQFSGPQINITGQLALAGAQGGGALGARFFGAARSVAMPIAAANTADELQLAAGLQRPRSRASRRHERLVGHGEAGERKRTATPRA